MKKWIMATAFFLGLSGFAAAQSTSSKKEKKSPAKQAVKKGEAPESGTKTTVKDSLVVKLPMPATAPDTLRVPKGKNEQ